MVRCCKAGTEYSKIGEGVLQQRVPALELLDQVLLPTGTVGQNFDCSAFFRIRARCFAQSIKRIIVRVCHASQGIVISRQADARGQYLTIQRALESGKVVERPELSIITIGIKV